MPLSAAAQEMSAVLWKARPESSECYRHDGKVVMRLPARRLIDMVVHNALGRR